LHTAFEGKKNHFRTAVERVDQARASQNGQARQLLLLKQKVQIRVKHELLETHSGKQFFRDVQKKSLERLDVKNHAVKNQIGTSYYFERDWHFFSAWQTLQLKYFSSNWKTSHKRLDRSWPIKMKRENEYANIVDLCSQNFIYPLSLELTRCAGEQEERKTVLHLKFFSQQFTAPRAAQIFANTAPSNFSFHFA
jgi:hypothetical protein